MKKESFYITAVRCSTFLACMITMGMSGTQDFTTLFCGKKRGTPPLTLRFLKTLKSRFQSKMDLWGTLLASDTRAENFVNFVGKSGFRIRRALHNSPWSSKEVLFVRPCNAGKYAIFCTKHSTFDVASMSALATWVVGIAPIKVTRLTRRQHSTIVSAILYA